MSKTSKSYKPLNNILQVKNQSSQSSSITEDFNTQKSKRKKISRLNFFRTILKNSLESFYEREIYRENITIEQQLINEIKKPIYLVSQRGSTVVKKLNYEKDLYVIGLMYRKYPSLLNPIRSLGSFYFIIQYLVVRFLMLVSSFSIDTSRKDHVYINSMIKTLGFTLL